MQTDKCHSLTLVLEKPNKQNMSKLAKELGSIDGLKIIDVNSLCPGTALDLTIEIKPHIKSDVETALFTSKIAVDYCLQTCNSRRKKLLICDMDSTLIGQECIDELADFAGVKQKVASITKRAMGGELDFEQALKERVGLLKGLPVSVLSDCYQKRISLNKGVKTLARTMKANGAHTVIVSGGFTFFSSKVAKDAGFDIHLANTLLDDGQALTGTVAMPILGRDAKKQALIEHATKLGGPEMALAIGDGANDLAMIQTSGLGIAYRAKPIVAQAADCAIKHTDLTTALYFQGYKKSEFMQN